MPTPPLTYNVKNLVPAQIKDDQQVFSADGTVSLPFSGQVVITKASAIALTLPAPATADDGTEIQIISTTAAAHVITSPVRGFNKKASSGTCTFGAAIGNSATVVAYQGDWYVVSSIGNTVA